jgi:hypothetical protein
MWRRLLGQYPTIHSTAPAAPLASNFVNGIKHLPFSFD